MKRSKIIGVGSYVPPTIFTNHDLEKMMNTSDEWIVQRTGIKERRWVCRLKHNAYGRKRRPICSCHVSLALCMDASIGWQTPQTLAQ